MSSLQNNRGNGLQTSLEFQKEFSYINIIQDELSKDKKKNQLKLKSKILIPSVQRKLTAHKQITSLNSLSKSQIRRKSKTIERSPSKKKNSEKKSLSKKEEIHKKLSKAISAKHRQVNTKSNKSIKSCNFKKPQRTENVQHFETYRKKKNAKEQILRKPQKILKSNKNKSTGKIKLKKAKSLNDFQNIPLSSITKQQPKIGAKQSKVIHQYFGMDDKLSSILEYKQKKKKTTDNRDNSKLSKCKTKSSSSITIKDGIKFTSRGSRQQK